MHFFYKPRGVSNFDGGVQSLSCIGWMSLQRRTHFISWFLCSHSGYKNPNHRTKYTQKSEVWRANNHTKHTQRKFWFRSLEIPPPPTYAYFITSLFVCQQGFAVRQITQNKNIQIYLYFLRVTWVPLSVVVSFFVWSNPSSAPPGGRYIPGKRLIWGKK